MRYSAAEKVEVIRLVEASHLPARLTLNKLGIPRATFYRWYDRYRDSGPEALGGDRRSRPDRVWNRIPEAIRDEIIETWRSPCPNSAHANWRCASATRKSTSSRRLRSIDC